MPGINKVNIGTSTVHVETTDRYPCNAYTHGGTFHADEVFATVILAHATEQDIHLRRVNNADEIVNGPFTMVYDIGGGEYDHHQPGGNGARENGVPYAACGLIWRDFGHIVSTYYSDDDVDKEKFLWDYVDRVLIQGIDAKDNGAYIPSQYPCMPLDVSNIISFMNPNQNTMDHVAEIFGEALEFAEQIFMRVIWEGADIATARKDVMEAIKSAHEDNRRYLVFDHDVPWVENIFDIDDPWLQEWANDMRYVVYPGKRGGYQWRAIPIRPNTYTMRHHVPKEWLGLNGGELRAACGVVDATFVHKNGFIGGADSYNGAVQMVKWAIEDGTVDPGYHK